MTTYNHAVLWIDHNEAHAIYFDAHEADSKVIHAPNSPWHIHATSGTPAGTHLATDPKFLDQVSQALAAAREVLVLGPSSAKDDFVKHVGKHDKALAQHILGVETADKMSDAELVAAARRFFKAADRMRPQLDPTRRH
jgi:hypothetical protein